MIEKFEYILSEIFEKIKLSRQGEDCCGFATTCVTYFLEKQYF